MKLSDIVSAMHLPIFAEVPLLVFMGIFIGVAVHLLGKRDDFSHAAALPLSDDGARQRRARQ
jgi:cbb3-type cytochrome oxidase subunit 3